MESPDIRILIVDDVPETRQGVEKLLQIEPGFTVIGTAGTGRQGVAQAKALQPDVILMDINMPDMDGLEAARQINSSFPWMGIIMMSVQNETSYMQQAMLGGAGSFLTKPLDADRMYTAIRDVHARCIPLRRAFDALEGNRRRDDDETQPGKRGGNVIVVYSPTGGAGCTTLAINLASALTRPNIKTLLIDASVQSGSVHTFLALNGKTGIVDALNVVDDLDPEYFENIVTTHNSGLKVLTAPAGKKSMAAGLDIRDTKPEALALLVEQIAPDYDFLVLDAGKAMDMVTASLLERATRVVLVVNPTLPSVTSAYGLLEWLHQMDFALERVCLVVNKARPGRHTPSPEKVQQYLRRPVEAVIPLVDEDRLLSAINRGLPMLAAEPDASQSPVQEITALANHLFDTLMRRTAAPEPAPAATHSLIARALTPLARILYRNAGRSVS